MAAIRPIVIHLYEESNISDCVQNERFTEVSLTAFNDLNI